MHIHNYIHHQMEPSFGAPGMTRQQLLDARMHVRVTGSYLVRSSLARRARSALCAASRRAARGTACAWEHRMPASTLSACKVEQKGRQQLPRHAGRESNGPCSRPQPATHADMHPPSTRAAPTRTPPAPRRAALPLPSLPARLQRGLDDTGDIDVVIAPPPM